MNRVWLYEATVVRHVDGDTTILDIDQGMNHWSRNQYVRYAGINAPELSTPEGKQALAFLETVLLVGQKVALVTIEYHEFEKYGRVLGVLYPSAPTGLPLTADLATLLPLPPGSVNQMMLDSGNAVAYDPSNL